MKISRKNKIIKKGGIAIADKYEFSKEDYLMYKEFFEEKINEIEIVSIDSVRQKHDKTFKEVLGEEKEMSKFLKQFVGLEIEDKELEKYKSSFITKKYEKRESDIIYKNKKEEIYYLIEHQSSVDKNMPRRIEVLLKNNTKMSIMMLLEKNRSKEEIREVLIEIIPKIKNKEKREWLKEIIEYILGDVLGKEKEEILKLIKEEESDMEEWVKTIKRNEAKKERELINKGKIEAIKEMIKNLLKFTQDEELILKCTNIGKEEFEKLKKEIQEEN